jgi:DNA-binding MarR family transcriptional regulator/N-acetylglutamate synthase-like GNAT family acetyltransferase
MLGGMPTPTPAETVRRFNRFYTIRIGALGDAHLASEFSLTETRVLYELAHHDGITASEIAGTLHLDRGYLSRMLRAWRTRGLVRAARAADDGRRSLLSLTAKGRAAFAPLDRGATREAAAMLEPLPSTVRDRVVYAMETIRQAYDAPTEADAPAFTLRPHRPGDMGWVVERHGELYAREYGWDARFEALVARVVADFLERFDPSGERCWIAERNGERVGSIFVVRGSKHVAKLRLLLVDPSARGLGIGQRLVDEVIRFSREAGYRKITLWTQRNLVAARRIYRAAGFTLVGTEKHRMFGKPLVAETWELAL